MAITSPQQLMALKLQHIQDAEHQVTQALQQIRQQVQEPQLHPFIDRRLRDGQELLQGIQQLLPKMNGEGVGDLQNHAVRGLIEEGRMTMSQIQEPQLKAVVAIGGIQALEHYCIAAWGTVKALAQQMGEQEVVQVMQRALDSGKRFDQELTQLAESRVNPQARGGAEGRQSPFQSGGQTPHA